MSFDVRCQGNLDSLKRLRFSTEATKLPELNLSIFIKYSRVNLDSALKYANEAKSSALFVGDSLMVVRAENAIGWVYKEKGYFKIAIDHYLEALGMARRNNFATREKHILNNLGLAHYYDGNYDKSLSYHFESLSLREAENNLSEIAISCNNIGLVYFRIRDYENAIKYFIRSKEIDDQTGNFRQTGATLANLGLSYAGIGNQEEALNYFKEALDKCNQFGCQSKVLVEAYHGVASSYYTLEQFDLAEQNYLKALELSVQDSIQTLIVITNYSLARLKLQQNLINEALDYLGNSNKVALKINYRTWIRDNYQLYGQIYSRLGEFEKAYTYQKKYDSLNSGILNEEVITNLAKIQADYQERENLQTIASQDEEISRRTTLLTLSLIIILLITVILFILYRINQLRKKANTQLSEANAIIEKQNKELTDINNVLEDKVKERTKELKDTNAALLKSNTDLDNFIYKTSHDIRGPLATLQGMCNIALMDITEPKSVDYFEKIGKTADRLNEILSKLLVINQINNSMIASSQVDVGQLMQDILQEYQHAPEADKIRVDNNVQEMNSFRSDEGLLRIILNNLISNAFKFYNSSNRVDSWIRIDADRCNGHVEFRVTDNGIGIDEAAAGKIFEIFAKASEVSDSAGLGLYLVKLAVEKLNGSINHSKTEEGYTQFTVELPYK